MWMTGGGGLLTKGIAGVAKGLGIYNATKAVINGTKLAQKLSKGANFVRSAQAGVRRFQPVSGELPERIKASC